jgi:hypothetical protein
MTRPGITLVSALSILLSGAFARPEAEINILLADARVDYPVGISFSIEAESGSQIRTLELEYGLTGRDCTPDLNVVVPGDFSPTGHVDLTWTWSIAASGNLPPGMRIWWDWRIMDAFGNEVRTEKQWITWIDDIHDWQLLSSDNIHLYWYHGTEAYNRGFLKAAEDARGLLRNDLDAWPSDDIHIYIYGSNKDLKDALTGEPDWIGGLSFDANQRTIMIGIPPEYADWGLTTIAHELAHTAVDSIMGGCYASIPLWLNEGIAIYAEGELDEDYQSSLDDAIYFDSLFSLRSISYTYQEIDGDPTQTYAQSYSIVKFLIEEYGQKKIRQLLDRLGEGYTYDNALRKTFGVDMDGLEAAWRKAIGADPMQRKAPAPSPTAFLDATIPPVSSTLAISTLGPLPPLPATVTPKGEPVLISNSPPGSIPIICVLGFLCIAGIGALGLMLFWRANKNRTAGAGR